MRDWDDSVPDPKSEAYRRADARHWNNVERAKAERVEWEMYEAAKVEEQERKERDWELYHKSQAYYDALEALERDEQC